MPGEEVLAGAAPDLLWTLIKIFGPVVAKELFNEFTKDPTALEKFQGSDEYKKFQEIQKIKEIKDRYDTLKYSQDRLEKKKKDKSKKWDKTDQKMYDEQAKELAPIEKKLNEYYKQYPQLKNDFQEGYKTMFNEGLNKYKQTQKMFNDQEAAKKQPTDQRFQQYSPEQSAVLNQLSQLGLKGLQENKFDFGPIEEQARSGFKQKTIPSIMERFTSLGSKGSQRSSAFPQLLSQAGADLEKSLATMKQNYNLGRESNFANMANIGLRPQYGYSGPLVSNNPQQSGGDTVAELVKLALQPENVSTFKNFLSGFGKSNQNTDTSNIQNIVKDYIQKNYGQGGNVSSTQKNPYQNQYVFASDDTINNALDDFLNGTEL